MAHDGYGIFYSLSQFYELIFIIDGAKLGSSIAFYSLCKSCVSMHQAAEVIIAEDQVYAKLLLI